MHMTAVASQDAPPNSAPVSTARRSRLDTAGSITAGVCAVHCLVTPLLLTFGWLGAFGALVSERFEVVFVGASLIIGLLSLGPAFIRQHRDPLPLLLFVAGLGTLLGIRALGIGESIERGIVPVCATLLVMAHWRNHRLCSHCRACSAVAESPSAGDVTGATCVK